MVEEISYVWFNYRDLRQVFCDSPRLFSTSIIQGNLHVYIDLDIKFRDEDVYAQISAFYDIRLPPPKLPLLLPRISQFMICLYLQTAMSDLANGFGRKKV